MNFTRANTIGEALAAKASQPDAQLLAGGTDLMVEVNLAFRRPQDVIGIGTVTELKEQTPNRIGAGVTWETLESSPHQALAHLARTVGSPQIRAAGTIGGNIGTASPAGDGLPWIAAIDAEIEVASQSRGRRLVPWSEFFTGVKRTSLADDEMVTAVALPDYMPTVQHFAKIGVRSAMVISTVSCVVARGTDGFRVALGSVAPTVVRVHQAEEFLNSEPTPSDTTLDEFAVRVSEEVSPITDHRSTEAYRRHAAGVLARRLVERCLQ